jgi:hypothetical protein
MRLLVIAAGVGLAIVVGREGSVAWVVLRVLAVVAATHVTVVALRREGRLGLVAAVGFGAVASAVGGGIAAPHVEEVGWDADGIVGTVTSVLGIVLVVVGTVRLVRSYRRWGRLAALALTCGAIYVAMSVVVVSVATTNVPREPLGIETPSDRGLAFESVTFTATDGVRLAGWFVPPPAADTVVLVPDADTTRSSVLDHAEVLAGMGLGVLLFDPRGQGESAGRAMALGWDLDRDVEGAVDFVASRPEVGNGRIVLIGTRAGGAAALGVAVLPRVCGVVADGVTGRVLADRIEAARRTGVLGIAGLPVDASRFVLTELLTTASAPRSLRAGAAREGAAPALLIATLREPDEPRLADAVRDGMPDRVEVWIVPGAGSAGAIVARREEWTVRVRDFLGRARC